MLNQIVSDSKLRLLIKVEQDLCGKITKRFYKSKSYLNHMSEKVLAFTKIFFLSFYLYWPRSYLSIMPGSANFENNLTNKTNKKPFSLNFC